MERLILEERTAATETCLPVNFEQMIRKAPIKYPCAFAVRHHS